jgi:hypothetical protein
MTNEAYYGQNICDVNMWKNILTDELKADGSIMEIPQCGASQENPPSVSAIHLEQ